MSRRGKHREVLAPSLFPFLAVLLCTMGALVLILVLIVSQAQASVSQVANSQQELQEEMVAKLEAIKESLEKERTQEQLELEKKRLTLQAFEEQIQSSLDELKQLDRTLELIDSQASENENEEQETQHQISLLEKQLADATEKLTTKLEKPTGDKPIFAIIPYDGPNGTHRRPIYLECTDGGIVVQPEGVAIRIQDLRPPYGPGNPLDAVLRTVRTRYAPSNGALTSTAYPLLVVRPSGIHTYALARLAMAGWDDQFGYELVEDEMDLEYPEGEPGLRDEVEKSLTMARARQTALVMAMPGKYRRYVDAHEFEEYRPLDGGHSSAVGLNGNRGSGTLPGLDEHSLGATDAGSAVDGNRSLARTRGGFNIEPSEVVGSGALDLVNGQTADLDADSGLLDANASSGSSFFGSKPGISNLDPNSFGSDLAFSSSGESTSGSGELTALGQAAMNSTETSVPANSVESSRADFKTGRGGQTANQNRLNGIAGVPTAKNADNDNGSPTSNPNAATGSGGKMMARPGAVGIPLPAGLTPNSAAESSDDSPGTPSLSFSANNMAAAEPVALRKGRNWAWSGQSGSQTAVVRTIRVVCRVDRWVILPEAQSGSSLENIMLNLPPQACAERFAKFVAQRVDRWGLALISGYWKPVLVVEVLEGAETQFQQLEILLDGSGLEVQRVRPKKTRE